MNEEDDMAHWRSMMDSQWLRFVDIEGHEPVVTISRVVGGEVVGDGGKKSRKPVLYFQGKEKPLAANVSICKAIEGMYGGDPRGWVGKRIKLYVTTTEKGGETCQCIRVRPGVPEEPRQQRGTNGSRTQQRQPEPAPPDEPPAREPGDDDGYNDDAARAAAAPTDEEMS